ncbi:hypothetical protein [Nocardia sp. NPDC052566]|uniref:hypothetical protein n=1 Tax=Nocardia sp. NPDC052566 TaxID=3364330 RepID=UPI0037C7E0C3
MPTLTQYWFDERYFGGEFLGANVQFDPGGWAEISETGGVTEGTLVRIRPDSELVIDIAPLLNTRPVFTAIKRLLGTDGKRTSRIRAAGVFWIDVPAHDGDPNRHNDYDMLVKVDFDFHIETPWYCTDVDGTIAYFLVLYLDDSGHLAGYVDSGRYDFGGGTICSGAVGDALDQALIAGIPLVQGFLDTALSAFGSQTFWTLYYLPGDGTAKPGTFRQNGDNDVAVVGLQPV